MAQATTAAETGMIHVTLNALAGAFHHLVYSRTLTMFQPEWSGLEEHLCSAPNDDCEVQVITSQRAAEEPYNL